MLAKLAAAAIAGAIATSAAADPPATRDSGDPNRVICEDQRETGSRLARRRVCMTAAEWAEQRRQMRQGIERMQVRGTQDPN